MERSTGTWFVIALVLGVAAFVGTLMLSPVPGPPSPAQMTPEQREAWQAEEDERRARRRAIERYGQMDRADLLIARDWAGLGEQARAVLALDRDHLWARLDLLHAIHNGAGSAGEMREQLDALAGTLDRDVGRGRPAWQWHAAAGWHAWFSGDETLARESWGRAAAAFGADASPGSLYNRAGYLSLSGDVEGGLEAWERALEAGWGSSERLHDRFEYAGADYDNRELIGEPRFAEAIERRLAARAAQEAERARLERERLEREHAEAHPPMPEGGSHGAGPAGP